MLTISVLNYVEQSSSVVF